MLWLVALLLAAPQNVINAGGGNALTLPAARHIVRLDPGNGSRATWLLAVQQDGADGHWLSMYRSTDEAQTWSWYAPIQDACCERDTPDLVQVGMDVALVYSYEGPSISGSTGHDVYFQWWRWNGSADWTRPSPVRVFDSTSGSTAYLRAELAIDSAGRLWVWAQRLNSDGTFTMVMSVSADGGATFQAQPSLDTFSDRPGGRILPVGGNRLMLLYGTHGVDPGYMRMRNDSDPLGTWSARQAVFSEGLYHGAALSAAGDGSGGVHLVYKDVGEQLWYRHWSGTWGARTQIESSADWALQPAITRVGGSLVIFWNRMLSTNTNYQFRYKVLDGGSFGSSVQLDGSSGFKGYPASVESLPNTVPQIPCLYGKTPDANSSGSVTLAFAPTPNGAPLPPPPPPPDGGTPDAGTPDAGAPDAGTPDAGTPDAGTPDAGTPDAGTPPPQTGVLFSDNFDRTSGLGSAWRIVAGLWRTPSTRAESDLDGTDQVTVVPLSCADCSVQARVVNFAAGSVALDLRVTSSNNRYSVALLGNGHLQIQRRVGSTTTVLGDVASGVADLGDWATIGLSATGAGPVQLVASVNGATKLAVSDASSSAIAGAGTAGMSTALAGIWFDDFVVTGLVGPGGGGSDGGTPDAGTPDAGTPDAGTPDAGTPDAGAPDAGTPDAGTPDAGTPDAGPPDAGTPDAGPPDAGTPDAGTPDAGPPDAGPPDAGTPDAGPPPQTGVLFSDDFNRSLTSDLGPRWTVLTGFWRDDNRANSDLDALDRAAPAGVSCSDCRIDAKMVNFGGGEAMLELRGSGNDRYALALTASGRLEVRRYRSGTTTVLGGVASGIPDLTEWHSFSFAVQGSGPVTLTAFVDGVPKISATDSSTSALTSSGASGIAATMAGILFDDFTLSGIGRVDSPPDAGTPDAGAPDAGTPDAGTPDAGTPDAGTPDAGTPDAGTPDGGPTDAGSPDAGSTDGGTKLTATVTYTETGFDLMAVDPSGTAYGVNLSASSSQVWSTVDGRSWSKRGATPNGESFWLMTALSDGILLADVSTASGHALARSTDHGVTWKVVLNTGSYRTLTPHSYAELDGAVYYVEYQVFTTASTPIRLWKSNDRGATWSVQFTFQGHRHAHGLMPDPARHALFAFFGDFDAQSGLFRSTDGGASWKLIIGNKQAGDIVDGVVLSDGSFLCGQDISYRGSIPDTPQIARIGLDGTETDYQQLPAASYSTHAVSTGGYVVGSTYEMDNDVSPAGWTRGSIWGSGDGAHWQKLLDVPRLSSSDDVRTDVYWELATGELVVSVRNASGFGSGGRGYMLLHTIRQ